MIDWWLRRSAIAVIKFYQAVLSPDHAAGRFLPSWGCRFLPTCSHYALEAYLKYNFITASLKVVWRLLRCQPFNKGGYDPV